MVNEIDTARALFSGPRLTQARTLRGMLKGELAAAVGLSPAAIGQFESGSARPSAATLGRLAMALGVPAGFLSGDRRQFALAEDDAHFRSLRSTSKRDRSQARAQVEILAEVVEALAQRVRLPDVALPESVPDPSPESAAQWLREQWGLGDGPVASVVGLLERKGVVAARLPAATDEVDAFSCWVGGRPFVILASNKGDAARSRFDAAHELGHLVLHHDAYPADPVTEREANRFAAEFLTPAHAIAKELPWRADWRALAALKLRWRVSIAMLLLRARDLGVLSESAYRRAVVELNRRGWRRDEPGSLGEPERPEVLGRAMELLAEHRSYTVDSLAGELRLGADALVPFEELLSRPEALAL